LSGWDELEALATPDIREADQKRDETDRLMLRVLGSEDGQKLMAWMQQMYVDVPIAVPGTDPSHAYYADGQRSVVRDIQARIKRARNL
jgi:hypothetical protein